MNYQIQKCSLVPEEFFHKQAVSLQSYIAHIHSISKGDGYSSPECSVELPQDATVLARVEEVFNDYRSDRLEYIIVVGIGGSNLGTKAIYDALYGSFDHLNRDRYPRLIFLDTQDESTLRNIAHLIDAMSDKSKCMINVISKSGSTTETAANFEVLSQMLSRRFGPLLDRVVFTTDAGSKMDVAAKRLGIKALHLPALVGGRYSVFSAVGLFPLLAAGIDIKKLRKGAQEALEVGVLTDYHNNPSLSSAITLYYHWSQNKTIHDTFVFIPHLESLGKWYRQLMGESVGKDHKGITPTVSVGSTDLHSVGQLYLGGVRDKITTFVYDESPKHDIVVPPNPTYGLVEGISNLSIASIMSAIVQGTMRAYTNEALPYMSIGFEGINEFTLGSFMQFKMLEMMYLGKLMGVNSFDQPHVELYKKETRTILASMK